MSLKCLYNTFPDYSLLIGGSYTESDKADTVEVAGLNPNHNIVPECLKVLNNFPTKIAGAVGTAFGE